MANADKNIVITPNIGSTTADPRVVFSGASSTLGPQNITLQVYPTNNGTLSFEGSAGQLFSITNSLSGTIFSVNDVSGIPSIEVLDTGLVKIAQYSGRVLIGTGTDNGVDELQVNGDILATSFKGNATTSTSAATLTTARTIGGVSFNGSANIDLPGVNTAGNQNTTGSAATLTTTRTIWGQNFNGGANVTGALSSVTTLSMNNQLTNTLAIGTAPFVITSTTRVSNLNVATAGTADTWTTGRTLTIGATGKSVNGSANVSWTLAEIGAQKKVTIQDAAPAGAASDLWWDSDAGTLSIYYGSAWVEVNPSLGTTSNPQFNSMGIGIAASGVAGRLISAGMTAWNPTTPGTALGNIQIGNTNATVNSGGAITFAARDGGGGTDAQAGIYINSNGTYGTRMYIATTNSYVAGSITAMSINENGLVAITRSSLTVVGDVTAYSSDIRLKTNIKPIENSLEKVHSLLGATFDWIENINELGFNPTHKTNDSGLLAQQVQAAFPQAVAYAPFDRDSENKSKSGQDYLTVKYEKLVPLLIEAVKEIDTKYQTIIEELKNEIKTLKGSK